MADLKTIIRENYDQLDPRIKKFGDEIVDITQNSDSVKQTVLRGIGFYLKPFSTFDKMCIAAMCEDVFPIENRIIAGGQLLFKYALPIYGITKLAQHLSNYIQ